MAVTETLEHKRTQKALDTLAKWGADPVAAGGENISFQLSRQGAPTDSFVVSGDCTPFTPSGKRGTLRGQGPGLTGEPIVMSIDLSGSTPTVRQANCTFAFNLNTGKVSLSGPFPGVGANLDFRVEYFGKFEGLGGMNLLFVSDKSSDDAAYVIALQLVAA